MNNTFSKIINAIIDRTKGDWNNMTINDKVLIKSYYIEMDEEWTKARPVIDFWKNLNIEDELKKEEEKKRNDMIIKNWDFLIKEANEMINKK